MTDNVARQYLDGLRVFFGVPDVADVQSLLGPSVPSARIADVMPWLQGLLESGGPVAAPWRLGAILPRYIDGRLCSLYICADDPRVAVEMIASVHAFIGWVMVDFGDRMPLTIDRAADDGERALVALFPGACYKAECGEHTNDASLWRTLATYRSLASRRPITDATIQRHFGRIRRDFEDALATRDEESAERFLDELKLTGRLSVQNGLYLRVQMLGVLGRWRELATEPTLLPRIKEFVLPAHIIEHALVALYQHYLRPHEDNVGATLEAYRSNIFPAYARMLSGARGARSTESIKMFMVREVAEKRPSHERFAQLIKLLREEDQQCAFVAGLASIIEASAPNTGASSEARNALEDCRFDVALELFLVLPFNADVLAGLLDCAGEMRDPAVDNLVLQRIENHVADCGDVFTALLQRRLDTLRTRVTDAVLPRNWPEWHQFVIAGKSVKRMQDAIECARSSCGEWPSDPMPHDDEIQKFADWLAEASDSEEANCIDGALSSIHEYFATRVANERIAKIVLLAILTRMGFSAALGENALQRVHTVTNDLLCRGLNKEEYSSVIDVLSEITRSIKSVRLLDWALDLTELLIVSPCPTAESRKKFVTEVISWPAAMRNHVADRQWRVLATLAQDVDLEQLVPDMKPKGVASYQDAKWSDCPQKIGLYTLTVGVGGRVRTIIEADHAGFSVELNDDHEATRRLTALAKNADVFVFAWLSAKHQAFACIQQERPADKPLLQPVGKGSSSILRCLEEYYAGR